MSSLKLAKLPDRTPVKITFKASPELSRLLEAYAQFYRETYGEEEAVPELIPYMLEAFLKSDNGFAKAQRDKIAVSPRPNPKSSRSRPHGPETASHPT